MLGRSLQKKTGDNQTIVLKIRKKWEIQDLRLKAPVQAFPISLDLPSSARKTGSHPGISLVVAFDIAGR